MNIHIIVIAQYQVESCTLPFGRRTRPPWRDSNTEPWNPCESRAGNLAKEMKYFSIPLDIEQLPIVYALRSILCFIMFNMSR
jgi:hypothetical protein